MKKIKKIQFVDSILYHISKKRASVRKRFRLKLYALKYLPITIYAFTNSNFIVKLIFCSIWWVFITMFFDHRDISEFTPSIRVWFGVPGSGKTSVGAWLSKSSMKNHYKVLSNVQIKGTYKLEEEDLGKYDMSFNDEGCHVIYDEATINGLDGRQFKSFANTTKPLYFSIHRHMNNRVDVFSQGYDIDKRIRDRTAHNGLFYLRRIRLKGFVCYRKIKKVLFINKEDKQMIDGFEFNGLPRFCYTRSVWNSFDTLDKSLCPTAKKKWELWHFED